MNKLYITELVEMPFEKLGAGHQDTSRCIEQTLPDLFKPFPSWVGLPQAETAARGQLMVGQVSVYRAVAFSLIGTCYGENESAA